jgi:HEAT repeat protein
MPLPGARWRIRSLMALVAVCALAAGYARYRHDMTPVERYRRMLRGSDPKDRGQAIVSLKRLGPVALAAEPELLAVALRDPHADLRHQATFALVRLESKSPALVRALVADFLAAHRGERSLFYYGEDPEAALEELEAPAEAIVPLLMEGFDKAEEVRGPVVALLCKVARRSPNAPVVVDALLKTLTEDWPSHDWPDEAARTLAAGGSLDARRRAVAALIPIVRKGPPQRALRAASNLGLFHPENAEAVAMLIARLRDRDPIARLDAMLLLGQLGEVARPAVPEIVRAMVAGDAGRSYPAFAARYRDKPATGAEDAESDPEKFDAPTTPESLPAPPTRTQRLATFITPASLPTPLELAKSRRSWSIRSLGALSLRLFGTQAEEGALGALIGLLGAEDEEARRGAIDCLGAMEKAAAPAVLDLLGLLLRDDEPEAARIAVALARIAPDDPRVIRVLEALLANANPALRIQAARLLGELGRRAAQSALALSRLLGSPDPESRRAAAAALGRVPTDDEAVIEALRDVLGDADELVRLRAAAALYHADSVSGPDRKAVAVLVDFLQGPDPDLRCEAVDVFRGHWAGPEEVIPALLEARDDEKLAVREAALRTLEAIAPGERRGAPWAAVLRDGTLPLRRQAACALGKLAPGDEASIAALIEALRDPDPALRAIAAASLGCVGPAAEKAAEPLAHLLKDDDPGPRKAAAVAQARVAPRRPETRAALAHSLGDRDPDVRRAAAKALGRIGPEAAEAADDLRALAHDDSPRVRAAASWALQAIEPGTRSQPTPQPGPATRADP